MIDASCQWRRLASVWAALLAAAAVFVGVSWNTYAAGGSDSHCYLQQARRLTAGSPVLREPLGVQVPWPAADLTFAPAGFVPSADEAGTSVPICPPGFAVMMAPLVLAGSLNVFGSLGERLPFLVVPLCGGWAVWLTWVIGRRVGDLSVGLGAAVLTACSPIFLFQIVQPMSDVPAAAVWLAAIAALSEWTVAGSARSGLAAGLALLVRPNLVPLAVVLGVFATLTGFRTTGPRGALGSASAFSAGLVPSALMLLGLQWMTYGAPLRTGYGDLGALFSAAHVVPNMRRYLEWLYVSHGPVLALALMAPLAKYRVQSEGTARAQPGPGWLTALLCVFSAATLGCYLPYLEFDVWWYIRFLLPAMPLIFVLAMLGLAAALRWTPPSARPLATTVVVGAVVAMWLRGPEVALARQLQRLERHFIDAGHVATRLPAQAVVLTVADSGGVRYHGQRSTLLWESLDPDWFDRALDALRQLGRPPYVLLEANELEAFKARFRGRTDVAELDWPPMFKVGASMFVYDPADRARFLAGARVSTEQLWSPVAVSAQDDVR